MRIGTNLNTFKLVPGILRATYGTDSHIIKKIDRALRYSPQKLLRWVAQAMGIETTDNITFEWLLDQQCSLKEQIDELRKIVNKIHIELPGDLFFLTRQIMKDWAAKQLQFLASLRAEGITYSIHFPQFSGLNIDSFLPNIRAGAVTTIRDMVHFLEPLDPLFYVLHLGSDRFFKYLSGHGSGHVIDKEINSMLGSTAWGRWLKAKVLSFAVRQMILSVTDDAIEKACHPNMCRSFDELSVFVSPQKVCLENLENGPFERIVTTKFLERSGGSTLLDAGHLIMQRGPKDGSCFEKYFAAYGKYLRGIHLHNVVQIAEITHDRKKFHPVIQDHKPLDAPGGLLPLQKILRLTQDTERRYDRNITVILEIYYRNPLPSLKLLAKEIKTFDSA